MRAAGAEVRDAGGQIGLVADAAHGRLDVFEALGDRGPGLAGEEALSDGAGDLVGLKRAIGGEEVVALLILLADD